MPFLCQHGNSIALVSSFLRLIDFGFTETQTAWPDFHFKTFKDVPIQSSLLSNKGNVSGSRKIQ